MTQESDKCGFVALIGRPNAGKSTLLTLMGGLDTPTSGNITVDGDELSEMSPDELAEYRRTSVGFIFQDFVFINPAVGAFGKI